MEISIIIIMIMIMIMIIMIMVVMVIMVIPEIHIVCDWPDTLVLLAAPCQ